MSIENCLGKKEKHRPLYMIVALLIFVFENLFYLRKV